MKPDKFITLFLSISLFIVLPFVYSVKLQDVELAPRMLFIACVLAASSLLCLAFLVRKNSVIKKDAVFLIFILFLFINSISFLRSINFGDGLFELLKLFLFYALLFQFILLFAYDEKNKQVFFKTMILSAILFIVFGGIQLYPAVSEFISGGTAIRINYSIDSTLGNKNFFSETLMLMLPLTLLSAMFFHSFWRVLSIFTAVSILVALAVLQTLSTWAALLTAGGVGLALLFRWHKKTFTSGETYRVFYIGVAGALLTVVLAAFVFISVIGTKQLKSRITAIQQQVDPGGIAPDSLNQNSTYERIFLWKNAIKMIADNAVSGVGLGNYKIISPSYGLGSARYMTSGKIRFVHPHNDFLLIASESGLTGLLIFLTLTGILFWYSWSISKKAADSPGVYYGIAMLCGLTAYMVISFFSLPSSRVYPLLLFMLYAALIVVEKSNSGNSHTYIGRKLIIVILLASFSAAAAAAFIGNKRLKSEFELSAALLQERKNNIGIMKRHLDKIDKQFYPLDVTATPIAWYQGFANFYLGEKNSALALFQEAERSNPNHLMVLNDLASCYNLNGDPGKAEHYFNKALKMQPAFGDALVNLSIIYYNSGKTEAAFSTLIKYKDNIKRESLPVFNAIILAKATIITQDTVKLRTLQVKMNHPVPLKQLLEEIREAKGNLSVIL